MSEIANHIFSQLNKDAIAAPSRAAILKLETALKRLPPAQAPVDHVFADHVYARCMNIPKGTVLTGKIHKTRHLCILAKGTMAIASEDGTSNIVAPCIFVSEPGIKRAGYALTDAVFITVHVTDKTDINEIMKDVVCDTYEEFEETTL